VFGADREAASCVWKFSDTVLEGPKETLETSSLNCEFCRDFNYLPVMAIANSILP
jgi:hypothetical protein